MCNVMQLENNYYMYSLEFEEHRDSNQTENDIYKYNVSLTLLTVHMFPLPFCIRIVRT